VQWTVGILRHFRAFSTPEQNPALKVLSTPAPPPLTQAVSRLIMTSNNTGVTMPIYKEALFVPSLLTFLLSVAIKFDENSIIWFWSEQPIIGGVLLLTSVIFSLFLYLNRSKRERSEK
jgi:hypothetical protein